MHVCARLWCLWHSTVNSSVNSLPVTSTTAATMYFIKGTVMFHIPIICKLGSQPLMTISHCVVQDLVKRFDEGAHCIRSIFHVELFSSQEFLIATKVSSTSLRRKTSPIDRVGDFWVELAFGQSAVVCHPWFEFTFRWSIRLYITLKSDDSWSRY